MPTVDLNAHSQSHLLRFADELSSQDRATLEAQINDIDFEQLRRLVSSEEEKIDWAALAARAVPPPAVRINEAEPQYTSAEAIAAGEAALRDGQLAVILVAGGQGTRLGFDQPKGMFPIGPVSNRTLFQMHCDRLLAVMQRYDVSLTLYVMTSPATDKETREYFANNNRCGLAEDQLQIFCQGTMPAVDDKEGRVLLSDKGRIALSPDGHGGVLAALDRNGCLNQAREAGVEHFFYAQVDNPLVPICDPELIGYHILSKSQITTQVVEKRFAKERVGNVVAVDGKVQIIEYSDLPDSAAEQTNSDGSLKFWAGNIAVHVFDRAFLDSVVDDVDALPFHRAHKKVPYIDELGHLIEPNEANAIKFERFVFDLLPLAERALVVEGEASKVFAPVKNADGAEVDTPELAKDALSALHRDWLQQAGVEIASDVIVEIHPAWALDAAEVATRVEPGLKIVADTFLR